MTAQPGTTGQTAEAGQPGRIELRDVAVSFPASGRERLVALDGVDLVVEPGQLVALIGPNGSGKSTLLRVIAGLLAPDRGEATLDGRPIDGPDTRIGLVFQEPRLLPWRTTESNVAYPLELAGIAPAERREKVQNLLRTVGLEEAREAGAEPALRRDAPASSAGADAHARAARPAPRRAVQRPRRAHAGAPQPRAAGHRGAHADDDHPRHPFGPGGDLPGGSRRGPVGASRPRRRRPAGRAAAAALPRRPRRRGGHGHRAERFASTSGR